MCHYSNPYSWSDIPLISLWSSFCLQRTSVESEDYDDSSVVNSCGFVPDNVTGQSHNRNTGNISPVNFILNVYHSYVVFLHSSEEFLEKFTTYKAEESFWEEQIYEWPWRKETINNSEYLFGLWKGEGFSLESIQQGEYTMHLNVLNN